MDDIQELSVRQLATAIRDKQLTSKQATQSFLDRIESVNPSLNAVINLQAETAMKFADRADIALAGGETPGPLFGVPMTIKDSLDTFDMVTTWGTQGRREVRPGNDATCVGRLRDAGAVLMGKTNTPEFTLAFKTDNSLFGKTNNPWDTKRTPGGSSGGAAAIIAARGAPFDIGTDTGGSIRLPSHFSGIAGIKPTTGRVPTTGNALPNTGLIAPLSQPGPMAKTVDDLIYLLQIIAGPDNIDPHAVAAPLYDPDEVVISQLKFAWHSDNGIKTPDPDIVSAVSDVVQRLKDTGHAMTETRPTGLEMAGFIFARVFAADDGDLVDSLLEDCRTTEPSPVVQNILNNRDSQHSGAEVAQTMTLWHNFQSSMLSFFDQHDILICPVNAHPAIEHDAEQDMNAYSYTYAYNLTGWPSVVIRAGTDSSGLPIGVQILARPFREDQCLAVARWLEGQIGSFAPPQI